MSKEKVLVVGLGEIGKPLFELLKESKQYEVYGFDINPMKMLEIHQTKLPTKADVVHICVPCSDQEDFAENVQKQTDRFKPKLLIINSTIPPGTTTNLYARCKCLVAHSPVRGVHKDVAHMKWELKRWKKYVGGATPKAASLAQQHFEKAGFKTKILKKAVDTELAKLFETTYRAWMISCFQEMHRISTFFKADFEEITDFLQDTHLVRHDRPVMFPDVIAGHCLIPNTEMLLESYDSKFLRLILESNEKRKKEVSDKNVQAEIEKIKDKIQSLSENKKMRTT